MAPTPEERRRIYDEEKAPVEARDQIASERRKETTAKFWWAV